jgi:hypothetical protein
MMAGMVLFQFHTLLYSSLEDVNAEFDVPAALLRKQNRPYLLVIGLGRGHMFLLETLESGKFFFSLTEIHSTTARLSSH